MECCVTVPVWVYDRPVFLSGGRIVGFHAEVKSEQEVCEVEAQSQPVGSGNLFPESVEVEHASRLIFVIVYCPDVARVGKQCSLDDPEEF